MNQREHNRLEELFLDVTLLEWREVVWCSEQKVYFEHEITHNEKKNKNTNKGD